MSVKNFGGENLRQSTVAFLLICLPCVALGKGKSRFDIDIYAGKNADGKLSWYEAKRYCKKKNMEVISGPLLITLKSELWEKTEGRIFTFPIWTYTDTAIQNVHLIEIMSPSMYREIDLDVADRFQTAVICIKDNA